VKIAIFGSGYVGLVSGICFADFGHEVNFVDVDHQKIQTLKQGKLTIYEPGLEEILSRNLALGRIHFTTHAEEGLKGAQLVFIAVSTPETKEGSADLQYVEAATKTIAAYCLSQKQKIIFVLKSTVPVGTSEICKKLLPKDYAVVVNNPEFLKEGTALNDFLRPERVVVGTDSAEAKEMMTQLYEPFVRTGAPILFMTNRSAELSKYAANSFLAMKVSFINDLALFCEKVGADIYDVRSVLTTDSRIGSKFLYPGAGYGGSCFPKDIQALSWVAKKMGSDLPLVEATHAINLRQKSVMPQRIESFFKFKKTTPATVALWGVSFKAETDDIRESPALALVDHLCSKGFIIQAYDPKALPVLLKERSELVKSGKLVICDSAQGALEGALVLAVMTEWNEFKNPDFEMIAKKLKLTAVFDGKNLYRSSAINDFGLTHVGIGLGALEL